MGAVCVPRELFKLFGYSRFQNLAIVPLKLISLFPRKQVDIRLAQDTARLEVEYLLEAAVHIEISPICPFDEREIRCMIQKRTKSLFACPQRGVGSPDHFHSHDPLVWAQKREPDSGSGNE